MMALLMLYSSVMLRDIGFVEKGDVDTSSRHHNVMLVLVIFWCMKTDSISGSIVLVVIASQKFIVMTNLTHGIFKLV